MFLDDLVQMQTTERQQSLANERKRSRAQLQKQGKGQQSKYAVEGRLPTK